MKISKNICVALMLALMFYSSFAVVKKREFFVLQDYTSESTELDEATYKKVHHAMIKAGIAIYRTGETYKVLVPHVGGLSSLLFASPIYSKLYRVVYRVVSTVGCTNCIPAINLVCVGHTGVYRYCRSVLVRFYCMLYVQIHIDTCTLCWYVPMPVPLYICTVQCRLLRLARGKTFA